MKKVILTEQQAQRLMNKVVDEQVPTTRALEYSVNDGRYQVECEFHISWGYNTMTRYKNGEIDDFGNGKGVVSYLIEIDHQPYGIKNIFIKDVKFPPVIDVQISYYPEGHSSEDEDSYETRTEETIKLPIDWRKVKLYKWNDDKHIKYLGVSKKIDIDVKPDGKGSFIGYPDEVDVREFHGNEDED